MRISRHFISIFLSIVILFTTCYISAVANTEINTQSNDEILFYETNAAADMSIDTATVTRDMSTGTVTYNMSPYWAMWTNYRTLPANADGASRYRIDFEISIDEANATQISSSKEIVNIMTCYTDVNNKRVEGKSPVTIYKMDIPSTGPNDFVTYSYYTEYSEGDMRSSEIKFYGGSRNVGFKIRSIKFYQVDEIKIDKKIAGIYNPAQYDQYKSEVLTKSTENGVSIVTYNPKNVLYNEGIHWEATWGPYTYTGFSSGLKKGYYRVDVELSLTGENTVSYVSDASNLISVGYKKYTVGDLAEDVDGDGYSTISYYFENATEGSIPEIQTRRFGKIGFKMRAFFLYAVSEQEYNDGLNAKSDIVWVGTAAESMNSPESAKVVRDTVACTMAYDPANSYSSHAIYGPYISLNKGKYRVDIDIAVNADDASVYDSDEFAFNFSSSHSYGVSFGPSTDVYKGDLKSKGKNDFAVFSSYINVTQESVSAIEFRFLTQNSVVGFIIREIRVYAVDEFPDYMTAAQPIWSANATRMSSVVGLASGTSYLLCPEMYVEYSPTLYGPYINFDAGEYKAVLMLKLQKNRESDDELLGYFDVCYTDETTVGEGTDAEKVSKRLEGQFRKNIIAKDLEKDNVFCAVEIPVTFERQAKAVEFRFFYSGKVPVKVSKIAIYRAEDEVPESAVVQDESLDRPEGVEPVDYCDVPLTSDNVRLLNKSNATFIENGKMGFVLESNVPGGVKYLKNKVYMTSGEKKVSLYLRSPDEIAGEFAFLQIAVLQGGAVSKYYNLTLNDFADSTGLCVPFEFTVNADENVPFDIIVNWQGNATIYIDKFIISSGDEMIGNEIIINTTKTKDGEKGIVKRSDVADIGAIDNVKIVSKNGYAAIIPASTIDTWFNGNDSFEVVFTNVSEKQKSKLHTLAKSTGHKVNDLMVFSLSAKSGNKALEKMASPISIEFTVDKKTIGNNKEKLETIGFLFDGTHYNLRNVEFDKESGKTTLNIADFGTVYSCLLIK